MGEDWGSISDDIFNVVNLSQPENAKLLVKQIKQAPQEGYAPSVRYWGPFDDIFSAIHFAEDLEGEWELDVIWDPREKVLS